MQIDRMRLGAACLPSPHHVCPFVASPLPLFTVLQCVLLTVLKKDPWLAADGAVRVLVARGSNVSLLCSLGLTHAASRSPLAVGLGRFLTHSTRVQV